MPISDNIRRNMLQTYRKKLGCKNIGEVCWCEICTSISNIVTDTLKEVKESIK